MHSLVLNHPFLDGNKRTAIVATLIFADLNGVRIRLDQREALDFMLGLAAGRIEMQDVVRFLRSGMVR